MIDSKSLKVAPELLWTSLWIICPPKHNFANDNDLLLKREAMIFLLYKNLSLESKDLGWKSGPTPY